jgi:hypothetical protein
VVSRRQRIAVVLDTNVLVRAIKTRSLASPNQRILRLWLINKRLQLVVSTALVEEYLEIFDELLGLDTRLLVGWKKRFLRDARFRPFKKDQTSPFIRATRKKVRLPLTHAPHALAPRRSSSRSEIVTANS